MIGGVQNFSEAIEVLAPAGSWESLTAALKSGADAVYFGVGKLNMRARAAMNFEESDLMEIVSRCHQSGARAHLTLNNVVYDEELEAIESLCAAASAARVDAVICHDLAVIERVQAVGLPIHLSTQANISNIAAVRFFARYAEVMVLARELNLEQIRTIARKVDEEKICGPEGKRVRLEAFVHGALCVAISGKCHMSLAQYNHAANRGDCLQNCRRSYTVRDTQTGDELEIDNEYVMSPRDLSTIACLPELLGAGISVLKIEGRGRDAHYVSTVVTCYREAVEAIRKGSFTTERVSHWQERLAAVFNRGFWEGGYYLGKTGSEWSAFSGNRATVRKVKVGRVVNYFQKVGVAEIQLQHEGVSCGDTLLITGHTTGALSWNLETLQVDEQTRQRADKGEHLTCPTPEPVRRNDMVFRLEPADD